MLFLYSAQALAVARNVTKKENNSDAVQIFKTITNSSKQYYNDGEIPKNESDKSAHSKCSTLEGAEQNCPQRMKAIKKWFAETRQVTRMQ